MYDPLLGGRNYDFPLLEQTQVDLMQRWQDMQQTIQKRTAPSTPIWNEIESIVDGMSEAEKEFLAEDADYQESSAKVQTILQREMMRHFKPIVESTKDGKSALESHLELLRKVHRVAKEKAGERETLMNEYIMNHSDKTWAEFIKYKQGKKK